MSAVPDYCEPLVAYRAWGVKSDGTLYALHHATEWPAKQPMVGTCSKHNPDYPMMAFSNTAPDGLACGHAYRAAMRPPELIVPVPGCACGIYAHKNPDGDYIRTAQATANRAWGEVHIWGRVLEHAQGYRAQFAYPKLLSTNSPHAALIEAKYGVPCVFEQPVPVTEVDDDSSSTMSWTPGTVFLSTSPLLPSASTIVLPTPSIRWARLLRGVSGGS